MKKHEKESLLKSFFIFFISLELLLGVIFSFYYQDKKDGLEKSIFLKMHNYNYTLEGEEFLVDIVAIKENTVTHQLQINNKSVDSYFPITGAEGFVLKISYPIEKFSQEKNNLLIEVITLFAFLTILTAIYSILYSFYAFKPLKDAYKLLEEFLKDIVHDLNTPVTSILLNSKLLRTKNEQRFIDRIELSAKTISSLHGNLQNYLHNMPLQYENVELDKLIEERIKYYSSLYTQLKFTKDIVPTTLWSNQDALQRIIDNIINNACKYNRADGEVKIILRGRKIVIADTGIGIKDSDKIFDRFYKESDRGLGIGLHIVKTLCDELNISIEVKSDSLGSEFILNLKEDKDV